MTASVFFALCKYSTSKSLVTNVKKGEKKSGSMKYFFQRVPCLSMDI